ncbi:hypothetical protein N656DRAFT_751974 [Canariomyces notabilis]|uniref:Uncharacterized protein n=1 Tax=Canariomyces notabilis TaxID=2074819 RepID=A0AAN6TEI9_9PEZI|nr:hypothetical protein N656DRAFT_751974 [Canariomyces arenarius]
MSSARSSFLSRDKYGYDLVVATTQASINSGLHKYLAENEFKDQFLCFKIDPGNGKYFDVPLKMLLDETKVNPFDIPAGTDAADPRIQTLTAAKFALGIKMTVGVPQGVNPKNLDIVTLGSSAESVLFNMYCKDITVIENYMNWGMHKWNVTSQPEGTPWYVQTRVNLTMSELDESLKTDYFDKHPDERDAIRARLKPLGDMAFSIQQLNFDLANALLQSPPTFKGLEEGTWPSNALKTAFADVWFKAAKERGLPIMSLQAVINKPDPSQLHLTDYERQVSVYKGATGNANRDKNLTTLDYLCAVNNNRLPLPAPFDWNWVDSANMNSQAGVVCINRNTIANFLAGKLLPIAQRSCISVEAYVSVKSGGDATYAWRLETGQVPQVIINPKGKDVLSIAYYGEAKDNAAAGATTGEFYLNSSYSLEVQLEGLRVRVRQRLQIYIYAEWNTSGTGCTVYDTVLTDWYQIDVDGYGNLSMSWTATKDPEDYSTKPALNSFLDFFANINDLLDDIGDKVRPFVDRQLKRVDFGTIQSFIFPGGRVFAFKNARWSDNQDLLADITYADTTAEASQRSLAIEPVLMQSRTQQAETLQVAPRIVTASSELIQNYIQAEIVAPRSKFEALQTGDGHALLFGLDPGGSFHVIQEHSGNADVRTGWQVLDLSTLVISTVFRNQAAVVRSFDVAQSAVNGTVSMAMAITANGEDHLFLSLGNPSSDTAWTGNASWVQYTFDAEGQQMSNITIVGILFAETSEKQQYIIVDIDRTDNSSVKKIERYYVDPTQETGRYWVKHDISVDVEDASYQSCIGRRSMNDEVDGTYTSGTVKGKPQLVYLPVVNQWGPGPAETVRMSLPNKVVPTAITTARNTDKQSPLYATTDLYAIGDSTLYRFPAESLSSPQALATSSVLAGTDQLAAMTHDGITTIWGKNASDQVYYLSCPASQLAVPGAWSTPMPIASGVERMSAYANRADGGNTIFTSGGGKLQRLVQSTAAASKVWRVEDIKLAVPATTKALAFKSYTTTVRVADENDVGVPNAVVTLTAKNRTPVYIHGLYYVLSSVPVQVTADASGLLSIVEAITNINGSVLSVSADGGTTIEVNPMEKSFQKLASLDSETSLRNASFPTNVKAGGIIGAPQTAPLVKEGTPSADVTAVAQGMQNLKKAYASAGAAGALSLAAGPSVVPTTMFFASSTSDVAAAAGDLFRYLKTGVEAAVDVFVDAVTQAWSFVVTIAGKAYRAVLDTVEAVVGALECVWDKIKTGVQDLMRYVEFLFEWDDIRRTKDVLHNMIRLYLKDKVDGIQTFKAQLDACVQDVEKQVGETFGVKDWSPLGEHATKPLSAGSKDPNKGQTSGSQLLSSHYKNNAVNLSVVGDEPALDVAESLLATLIDALEQEGDVLSSVVQQLVDLGKKFPSMTVGELLTELAGILVDGVLSSAQVVMDALLDVLSSVASALLDALDTKIYIPVISDILGAIGVPSLSFLDLVCWLGAVPLTVVYKLVEDEPPFPDTDLVKRLINASSLDEFKAAIQPQPRQTLTVTSNRPQKSQAVSVERLYQHCHYVAGMLSWANILFVTIEVPEPPGKIRDILGSLTEFNWIAGTSLMALADEFIEKMPVEGTWTKVLSGGALGLTILSKLYFFGPAQSFLKTTRLVQKWPMLIPEDSRTVTATIDAVLTLPTYLVTVVHFAQLAGKPTGKDQDAAIVAECANLCGYFASWLYWAAVIDKEKESQGVIVGFLAFFNFAGGALQVAEGAMDAFVPEK